MSSRFPLLSIASISLIAAAAACASPSSDDEAPQANDAITSNDGTALEMQFAGQVTADKDADARQAIVAQLQYTQGIFTSDARANAQVGLVTLKEIVETPNGDTKKISYSASLPVLWPKYKAAPTRYDLALPADVTKLAAFNDKYDGKCGNNEYGRETFWHDFNPKASGCTVDDADALKTTAAVRPHPKTTTGKYPEYDQVWADDSLDVVGVFGIISSNTPTDEGARERETFLREISRSLTDASRKDNAASRSIIADSTLTGSVMVGGRKRTVNVTALLVEAVSDTGSDFDQRFGPASAKADFVVYSGHSGLGANINALAAKSVVTPGKYQLLYLNGCQTFAYLGTGLKDKQLAANPSDPEGTKYLDIVANALPAYGDDGATSLTLYRAMLDYKTRPATYNKLLEDFSSIHLVAVFGEDDNTFQP